MGSPMNRRIGLLVAVLIASRDEAVGQRVVVPLSHTCKACRIAVSTPRGAIGDRQGFDRRPSDVVWRPDGSVLLLQAGDRGLPRMYNPNGEFRDIGRPGAGPGEYFGAILGAADGDTLYLFDRGNLRLSVVDLAGRVVRSAPAPAHTLDLVWLPQRRELLFNAHLPDRQRIGLAFHVFDALGNQVRSFAEADQPTLPGNPWNVVWRRTALDAEGKLIAATVLGRFKIDRWSLDGRLEEEYLVRLPWFDAKLPVVASEPPPPPPSVEAIHFDSSGILWALVLIPGRRWREGIGLTRIEDEKTWRIDWIDPTKYQDTRIVAIDLARGEVAAIGEVDGVCRFFSLRGEVVCDAENRDGSYRLDLRPVQIVGARGARR